MSREREKRQTREQPISGKEIPYVILHDPLEKSFGRDLTIAFKKTRGRRLVSPGGMLPKRTEAKALEEGIYRDRYEIFSKDALALGKPKGYWDGREEELAHRIAEDDDPRNYLIAEYSWLHKNRFNKIHRQSELERVMYSRRVGIHSDASWEAGKRERVTWFGQGVGSPMTMQFALNGAENLTILDGGDVTPHDGNRQWGPLIPSIGENHSIFTAKQVLQINPFINLECIPQNGSFRGAPGTYPMEEVVRRSGFLFDEMDSLLDKADLRMLAFRQGTPLGQITDLGKGVAVQFDDPRTGRYPCNGRLTPEVYEELQKADLRDFDVFMYYAVNVFMGVENITSEVENAFRQSREKDFYHIPQSGIAASKSGAAAYELFEAYFEGKEIPAERLIGYDWAA